MIKKIKCIAIFKIYLINVIIADVFFSDVTVSANINYTGRSEGVCVFDYNNDGWDDIFFTTRNGNRLYLYKNNGSMEFVDVTFEANLGLIFEGRMPVAADYDNDGDLDLFVGSVTNQSFLFQNNGNGTFHDVTSISGINVNGQVRGCSWVDYNRDGHLDLYVGMLFNTNKFFQNNGDGTFIDVAQNINATGPINSGAVMGLGFFDYDRDGDQDLYITQDNNLGNILLSYEDFGQFANISSETQTDLEVNGMGVTFGDLNRDGLFDIYSTNLNSNSLLLNNSSEVFQDISISSNTEDEPGSMGWGTFFFDVNNDGWLDIYNNNETLFGNVNNSLMLNNGDSTFSNLGSETGLILSNNGFGSAFSDLDHDGDLDMVLVGHPSSVGSINLLRNDSDQNNWIMLRLIQGEQNIFSIGSVIELYYGTIRQLNFIGVGNGYCGQNTLDVHFGLGSETMVDSVKIIWPDGAIDLFTGLIANNYNILQRGNQTPLSTIFHMQPDDFKIEKIYPNPFNNSLYITLISNGSKFINLNVYNLKGSQVISKKMETKYQNNRILLDFKSYPSGIYFIRIDSGYHQKLKKITHIK